jgi:transposase InsO family protein
MVGSPWENGFQESYYSGFKFDLGSVDQFQSLGELVEAIHRTIRYYNQNKIHSALKMPPEKFLELQKQKISDAKKEVYKLAA